MGQQRKKQRSESEIAKASEVHRSFSKHVTKFEATDGKYGTLSYEKMLKTLDLTHPRIIVKDEDGEPCMKEISLSHPVGSLLTSLSSTYFKSDTEEKN